MLRALLPASSQTLSALFFWSVAACLMFAIAPKLFAAGVGDAATAAASPPLDRSVKIDKAWQANNGDTAWMLTRSALARSEGGAGSCPCRRRFALNTGMPAHGLTTQRC